MKVIRAKILGYCFGARSAVNMALEAPGKYGGKKIVTYGHIIHNPVAIKQLAEAGVSLLEPPVEKIDFEGLAIIRAHGIPPATRSELVRAGWTILDATCPRIRESQKRAEAAFQDGSTVIIAGDKNHPEITGIAGYAPNAVIVENAEDAERARPFLLRDIKAAGKKAAGKKAVLIGQTTMGRGEDFRTE
jgi:4-hydroxy-3-methylbut-2-enyl diphosphate reductase